MLKSNKVTGKHRIQKLKTIKFSTINNYTIICFQCNLETSGENEAEILKKID